MTLILLLSVPLYVFYLLERYNPKQVPWNIQILFFIFGAAVSLPVLWINGIFQGILPNWFIPFLLLHYFLKDNLLLALLPAVLGYFLFKIPTALFTKNKNTKLVLWVAGLFTGINLHFLLQTGFETNLYTLYLFPGFRIIVFNLLILLLVRSFDYDGVAVLLPFLALTGISLLLAGVSLAYAYNLSIVAVPITGLAVFFSVRYFLQEKVLSDS